VRWQGARVSFRWKRVVSVTRAFTMCDWWGSLPVASTCCVPRSVIFVQWIHLNWPCEWPWFSRPSLTLTVALIMLSCCVCPSVSRLWRTYCVKKQICNGLWGIEWSRDRWRHVTLKAEGHDPLHACYSTARSPERWVQRWPNQAWMVDAVTVHCHAWSLLYTLQYIAPVTRMRRKLPTSCVCSVLSLLFCECCG